MTEIKQETKKQDVPRGHTFDGIEEYDNDLPRWWVNLFIVTVIFGVGYMAWYHLPWFPSQSLVDEYNVASGEQAIAVKAKATDQAFDFASSSKDAAVISAGKSVFDSNCAACHGAQGGGQIGPNLTDAHWIYGNKIIDVVKIINEGSTMKGMPAWASVLGPDKVNQVTAYIISLQGTSPANPKAPQGNPGALELQ